MLRPPRCSDRSAFLVSTVLREDEPLGSRSLDRPRASLLSVGFARRALHMAGKCSAIELYSQPLPTGFLRDKITVSLKSSFYHLGKIPAAMDTSLGKHKLGLAPAKGSVQQSNLEAMAGGRLDPQLSWNRSAAQQCSKAGDRLGSCLQI